jgi:two-component system sensor histidine kinase KdpD
VKGQEARSRHGRLKVFFGASPGVGKTYAMLQAANVKKQAGVDVVAGYVETHGRIETAALLDGLESLPRRSLEYRGHALSEFDLDAALARRPELILVDELAHTNVPGMRHAKRWKDVEELLRAGIDVYTTLNVQHLDSLNDIVAQVTGVQVRETVPDSAVETADEIELVDLPVNALLQRLEEGKVYLPDQAQHAMGNFFRPGNLIALRELALRKTAECVDGQMRDYRREHAIGATWPVAERLLVSIGPSPFSAQLVRAARRMAERLGAEWIAAFVETPDFSQRSREERDRVLSSLRLAEQLGAETVTLSSSRPADAVLQYARSRNVSRIILGKTTSPLWKRLLRGSIVDELVDRSGDIEISMLRGEVASRPPGPAPAAASTPSNSEWAVAGGLVAVSTVIALLLRPLLAPTNLAMVYLLGVVAVAMRCSRRASVLASVLSVAAFDFFCVPPYLTFAVSDYQYIITFAVMLMVAMVISTLTVRIRLQAVHAVDREARTEALYRLSSRLAGESSIFEAARAAAALAEQVFGARVVMFLPEDGRVSFSRRTSDRLPVPLSEEAIAQWVFDHGHKAGLRTDTLPGATALYLPLRGARETFGVLAVLPDPSGRIFAPEQQHLLEVFAGQTALAIERTISQRAAEENRVHMQTEQMRSSLLSAVSHDLRTPLASITGAASTLRSQGDRLPPETRQELLESISDEAERMGRLVSNLLDMTRLDSGSVELRRDYYPLEEIVGTALQRMERQLQGRAISTDLAENLPLVFVDDVLFGQVLWNLLENAVKYTPPATPVDLAAFESEGAVVIEVRDRGPGIPPGEEERIFQKFYRATSGNTLSSVQGAGLGLPICRAIVEAHRGTIQALPRPAGGSIFRIRLPSETAQ